MSARPLAPSATRQSPFHAMFEARGACFVETGGFYLPDAFEGQSRDQGCLACREGVSVVDRSNLRKFEVLGPDAEPLLQLCTTRNIRKLSVGQVIAASMCDPDGSVIDAGTLFRMDDDCFRWVCDDDASGALLEARVREHALNAWIRPVTDKLATLSVQGRHARTLLESITWTPPIRPEVGELRRFRFTVARIGGLHGTPLVVSRTGFTGELGYDVFCHPRDAQIVFDAVWDAGQPHGVTPLGLAALDVLRVEAGFAKHGPEIDGKSDPFAAGLGFTVSLDDKTDDFVGRDAIERRHANPAQVLVGLRVDTGGTGPDPGTPLMAGATPVGAVTSSAHSPVLGTVVALAKVVPAHAAPGTRLEIAGAGAAVVELPPLLECGRRVRGDYGG